MRKGLLIGAATLCAAVLGTSIASAAPKPPSKAPSKDTAAAEKAVKDAQARQNAVQKALEGAVGRRRLAEAQRKSAQQRLRDVDRQLTRLRAVIGSRARSTYMTGSPTSVAAVVGSGTADPDQLLDKMETIFQLAEKSDQTFTDLSALEGVVGESRQALARVEQEELAIEKELRADLDQADKALDERVAAQDKLRARDRIRAQTVADETAGAEAAGTIKGGGTHCDLSGIPSPARNIIMLESGGNPRAKNPSSTAFGLGQLLIGNRIRLMGAANAWSTDCGLQYEAFKAYTLGRYGTFSNAWAFKQSHGWY
jgi:hypothetical protein